MKHIENKDIDAILFGLRELDKKQKSIDTARNAQLDELILLQDTPQDSNILNIFNSNKFEFKSVGEKISLCIKYVAKFGKSLEFRKAVMTSDFSVAILENSYMNKALEKFSSVHRLYTKIHSNFNEICESVSDGVCEYGILPIESLENGKLLRFYSLIDRYDIKINAACTVESDDGSITQYALVGKSEELSSELFGKANCFEFCINLRNGQSLSDILLAASLCGLQLSKIDSLPIPYKETEYSYYLVFDISYGEIEAFLLYMNLEFPQYSTVGIFPKI